MGWNYRVVRRYYECPVENVERSYLTLTEVYYEGDNDDKPHSFTAELRAPIASEFDGTDEGAIGSLRWQLEKQIEALAKPILDERKDFGGQELMAWCAKCGTAHLSTQMCPKCKPKPKPKSN